jgi:hypothetical protein
MAGVGFRQLVGNGEGVPVGFQRAGKVATLFF